MIEIFGLGLQFNTDPSHYIQYFGQWQNQAMIITAFLILISILNESLFLRIWRGFPFRKKLAAVAILAMSVLLFVQLYFNPFYKLQVDFPGLSFVGQVALWIGQTHIRSIAFSIGLVIYLWKKFDRLLPAMAVGWFSLGVIELSFIPDMLISLNGAFLGWEWYFPFIGSMLFYLIYYRSFSYPRKFYLWFAAAVFVQYFLLIWRPWGLTIWHPEDQAFLINDAVIHNPPWESWLFEGLNHLMKALFVISFCFVNFKDKVRSKEERKVELVC